MRSTRVILVALATLALLAGCATPASTYRSPTLQITAIPNKFNDELASIKSPKIEEAVNRAFIDDGRFKQGDGLRVTLEITRFDPPRRVGTEGFNDRLGTGYTFLPGILVLTTRYYDNQQKMIDQVEFAQEIMPMTGEISNYAAINRAIDQLATRIRVDTVDRYLLKS